MAKLCSKFKCYLDSRNAVHKHIACSIAALAAPAAQGQRLLNSDHCRPASVVMQHAHGCHEASCSCCCPMQELGSHTVQVTGKAASWRSRSPGTLHRSPVSSAGTLQRRSLSAGTAFTQRALLQPHLTAGWADMLPGGASEPLLSADSAGSTASSARSYLTTAADTPQRDVSAYADTPNSRPADTGIMGTGAAAGAARLSAPASDWTSRSPSEYADTRSACMAVLLAGASCRGLTLCRPSSLPCAVGAVLMGCAVCTICRSGLGAAGTTQTALYALVPLAGSQLRHLDTGHPPWVPTSAGAVFNQALQAGFQLRQLGTARSCFTSQGPMCAQALQQAGCWLRRQQRARSRCPSQQSMGAQALQRAGVAPCAPSIWSWSTPRQPQMLAACVLKAPPQKWPCSKAMVRLWTLLLCVVHQVGLATLPEH